MRTTYLIHCTFLASSRIFFSLPLLVIVILTAFYLFTGRVAGQAGAVELKVMKMGLGSGTVTSSPTGINCGTTCNETYSSAVSVTLTATSLAGAAFVRWDGDCSGTSATCMVTMSGDHSVRAVFDLAPTIPTISDFSPEGIQAYLIANPRVNSASRFINALPAEYKQNWILMSRSESLQTGTAEFPRILLPSADARFVFTLGLSTHSSYPGAHPNAIEYMQWDAADRNFRFHEIVLDPIMAMGTIPARSRGVSTDDEKCSKCHSTQNVLNRTTSPGTTGDPVGLVKAKNKPNWDAYDSWGGMMPFNRDRIYQGSVEAAGFRKIFNPWTWRTNDSVRAIIEQLELQPPGIPDGSTPGEADHRITRTNGGTNDGHVNFAFDASPPVLTEPFPTGTSTAITTSYSFDGVTGTGTATSVIRGGAFITLHHSNIPTSDEGRGVRLFDALGGLAGTLNQTRIADELVNHRFATGSFPIDVRPIALAITKGCLGVNSATNTVTSTGTTALTIDLGFFTARNGLTINDLVTDTRNRAQSLPRRKADIQKIDLDRTLDPYLLPSAPANGLVQQYGVATSAGTDTSLGRLRQEVFRRPNDLGTPDATVMGGIYVDRELYAVNTDRVALYRYFLEPLGVSVDKWSMGVRGRSRTYTFADVFGTYENILISDLRANLLTNPVSGLTDPNDCSQLITAVNNTLSSLPTANAVPTYTDVQRIFNKSCIDCHGGLGYPPYGAGFLDLSEDEALTMGNRLGRSHANALSVTTTSPATSYLYNRITNTSEACPSGMMPCGGPALSKVDIETIRRWIEGPPSRPSTVGDPHISTVDGVHYDFQAAGEFVLLRDEGMEIQARQTAVETDSALGPNPHTGLTSCVSVNSAVAIRVGSQRITYQPNLNGEPDPTGLQLRIDGKLLEIGTVGIPLENGGRIIQSTAPGGIQIEAPGGSVVIITPGWWDYYQLWYLNIDTRHVRATQGVMGAIAPGSWLPALPNGSGLGPRPTDLHQRYRDLYGQFGKAWRVGDATSLFDYAPGTSTNTFTIENWPNGESPQSCTLPPEIPGAPNKPPVKALALEVAQQHCSEIVTDELRANCVQDVMVTGEPGFAETYLLTEQIQRNATPTTPELVYPEDNAIDLAKPTTFSWNSVRDSDGDSITYRHCVWPVNERPNNNKCNAVPIQPTSSNRSIFIALLVGLFGCILFVVLFFIGLKKKSVVLVLLAIAVLTGTILAYYFIDIGAFSKKVTITKTDLVSGQVYYWRVLAEDSKGSTIESETRRFEIK